MKWGVGFSNIRRISVKSQLIFGASDDPTIIGFLRFLGFGKQENTSHAKETTAITRDVTIRTCVAAERGVEVRWGALGCTAAGGWGGYSPTADVPSVWYEAQMGESAKGCRKGEQCRINVEREDDYQRLWREPAASRLQVQSYLTPNRLTASKHQTKTGRGAEAPVVLYPFIHWYRPSVPLMSNLQQMCRSGVLVRGGDGATDKSGNIQI